MENKPIKVLITLEPTEIKYLEEIRREMGFRSRSVTVGQIIRAYIENLLPKKTSSQK